MPPRSVISWLFPATPLRHLALAVNVDRELGPGRHFDVFALDQGSEGPGQNRDHARLAVAIRTGSSLARSQPDVFPRRRLHRIDAEIQPALSPETFRRLR